MSIIRKDKNVTVSALFGVAAIQIFIAGIAWLLSGGQIYWLFTFSAVIYIALGIAARWIRLPAAIIGSVFYAAFFAGISDLWIIFKIPVAILLLVAVVSAMNRPAAET